MRPMPPIRNNEPRQRKSDQDLLLKGIVILLIGLAVLLAPHVTRSPALQDLLAGSALVGWFALVLGGALLVQYFLRRRRWRQRR